MPLSETRTILVPFIWYSPSGGGRVHHSLLGCINGKRLLKKPNLFPIPCYTLSYKKALMHEAQR